MEFLKTNVMDCSEVVGSDDVYMENGELVFTTLSGVAAASRVTQFGIDVEIYNVSTIQDENLIRSVSLHADAGTSGYGDLTKFVTILNGLFDKIPEGPNTYGRGYSGKSRSSVEAFWMAFAHLLTIHPDIKKKAQTVAR